MKTSVLHLIVALAAFSLPLVSAQAQNQLQAQAAVQSSIQATNATQTDLRVRKIPYRADAIVVVSARPDFETMVSFAPGERIENVAVGDSTSWQVVPNKHSDLLFVKPISIDAHTNMAVVTDQRTYLFELRSDDGAGPMMYNLRFTYPDTAAVKPAVAVVSVVTTQWQASGDFALRPARAYDDGHSVFLYWPKETALPAILAVDSKGLEEPLTFTARDDYLITDGVPAKIVVRSGAAQAFLVPKPIRSVSNQIAGR